MKSEIEALEDVKSDIYDDRIIPAGTRGFIIEAYQNPDCYAVDVAIPSSKSTSGYEYDNIILYPHQFRVFGSTL